MIHVPPRSAAHARRASAKSLVKLACEMLPTISDGEVAELVEMMAIDLHELVRDAEAADEIQSMAMTMVHEAQEREIRQHELQIKLLDEFRANRKAAS